VQLTFIASVYNQIESPLLKARLADLLWLRVNPKKAIYARAAIDSYLEQPINSDTWYADIGDCWTRAIRLARQMKNNELIGRIETLLLDAFEEEYPNAPFMRLKLAKLIESNGLCYPRHEYIAQSLYESAEFLNSVCGYREAREYLFLAEQMFKKQGKEQNLLSALVMSANCFELEGDNAPNQMVANYFYEKALQAFRRIPAKKRDGLGVSTKLISIREKITEAGTGSLAEMELVQTPEVDISELVSSALSHVSNKEDLNLALLCFTGFSVPKYQGLKADAVDHIRKHPLSNLFGGSHIAGDGRVVAKTEPLDFNSDGEVNENKIFYKAIKNFQIDIQLCVKGQIAPALNQILSEYRVTKNYLKEICYLSPIVPEGRESLMASALWCGFEHDFANGIHLLAPQVEHLVRTILKNNDIHTSNVDKDGIENENGLTNLLKHKRTEAILGEDLLFELKAVFTESIGPNLRNEVAHGLLDDQSSKAEASVYAWWMVLRLVVRALYEFEKNDDD
jgi:hypothetical protein